VVVVALLVVDLLVVVAVVVVVVVFDVAIGIALPAARPNTTHSVSALPPSRLWPCTPPAASPIVHNDGTAVPSLRNARPSASTRTPVARNRVTHKQTRFVQHAATYRPSCNATQA
jgi:hypothetical protein